jgi:hypothetical protein
MLQLLYSIINSLNSCIGSMKTALFFLSLVISQSLAGQTKELNELFKKYTGNESLLKNYAPVALQGTKELILPNIGRWNPLGIIKWKDIDSAMIFSYRSGSVLMVLFGKVITYRKCETYDKGCVRYFNGSYKASYILEDKAIISLALTPNDTSSNKIRKRFKEVLSQLNNIPVTDTTYQRDFCFDCNYEQRPAAPRPAILYNDTTSEIVYFYDSIDHKGPFHLTANKIRNAKKLTIAGLETQTGGTITLSAVDLYIVRSGTVFHISNEGGAFNDELLKLIKTVEPGDSVILDQVRVKAPDGSIRIIQMPGFIVE